MRKISLALTVCALALTLQPASAAMFAGEGTAIDQPLNENLYITGGTVVISAPITGDVVAFAGDLTINAPVTGDIIAAGGTVSINDTITGDVRVASSKLVIDKAHVSGDIVYVGSQLAMGPASTASGTIMAQSGQAIMQGATSGSMDVAASEINFGGMHKGPIHLNADTIQFFGGTKVEGEVAYVAGNVVDAGALTAGKITQEKEAAVSPMDSLARFGFTAGFVAAMSIILAAMMMVVNPFWSLSVTGRMRKNIASSLFLGIFTIFAIPSLLGFLLGFQIVGAPWGLALLPFMAVLGSVYVLLISLSLGMIALLFARLLPAMGKKQLSIWLAIPIGAIITGIIVSIPSLGFFLLLLFVSTAVGAMVQTETAYLGVIPKTPSKKKPE